VVPRCAGLSLSLEMPPYENAGVPAPGRVWDGARSVRVGGDTAAALYAMLPSL